MEICFLLNLFLEIDWCISLANVSAGIWVLPIYWYRPKRSVVADKTLLYSLRIQTTCTRKHNEVKTVILQQH